MDREGKASPDFIEKVVRTSLGRGSRRLVVKPGLGLDTGVIALGGGRVLILTVDPVSAVPSLGMELSGWLSVHLVASDFTTSGTRPEFATFSYNFPPEMSLSDREEYVRSVGDECGRLGVSIAGGHTGSYPGAGFSIIGAGSMFGFSLEGGYVSSSMARPGDRVLLTGHAAIEATAYLAYSFPEYVGQKVGRKAAKKAQEMIRLCSTVKAAEAAAKLGLGVNGITSMHDATEGGILGALAEMSAASGKAFVVNPDAIPVPAEVDGVCSAFGIEPLTSLSEGALLMTCSNRAVEGLLRAMSRAQVPTREIGSVKEGRGLWLAGGGGRPRLAPPMRDGYWEAYSRSVAGGLK